MTHWGNNRDRGRQRHFVNEETGEVRQDAPANGEAAAERERPKMGRIVHIDELRARRDALNRKIVEAEGRQAQFRLRDQLVEVVNRHRLPVEQTVAVLHSVLQDASAAYTEKLREIDP